jgi:hypothetical protein
MEKRRYRVASGSELWSSNLLLSRGCLSLRLARMQHVVCRQLADNSRLSSLTTRPLARHPMSLPGRLVTCMWLQVGARLRGLDSLHQDEVLRRLR